MGSSGALATASPHKATINNQYSKPIHTGVGAAKPKYPGLAPRISVRPSTRQVFRGLFPSYSNSVRFAPLDQFDGHAFDGYRITKAQEWITLHIEQDVVWIVRVPVEPRVVSGSGDVIRV